tara:strand:+ start:10664 stop:11035 length:372 start_codon:yes stop_codon:yes gene_type:complete
MILSFEDAWYLILLKILILCLAILIMSRTFFLSLWNCNERSNIWLSALRQRKYQSLLSNSIAVMFNLLFLWIIAQGLILLVFGCLGVSPNDLLDWKFQEISIIGVLILSRQYYQYNRPLNQIS